MPRSAKTSDFWRRLTQARLSCAPPKSMRQEDIAHEYSVRQSAVTKWKTGGPKGTSLPDPDVVTQMALDTNVNVNWLWANQGDMRPMAATDPIVYRVAEVMNDLPDQATKLRVHEYALLQRAALQVPSVAQQIREAEAQYEVEQQKPAPRKRRRGNR